MEKQIITVDENELVMPLNLYTGIVFKPLAKVNDEFPYCINLKNISRISFKIDPRGMPPQEVYDLVMKEIKREIQDL